MRRKIVCIPVVIWPLVLSTAAFSIKLDETPANVTEWGYRPAESTVSQVNPPAFCWRPQEEIVTWELECARGDSTESIEYETAGVEMNVHCPPRVFPPGEYNWRYRGVTAEGKKTNWSQQRTFTLAKDAVPMPLPPRRELLARIPKSHPRLFIRPEDLPKLRRLAEGPLKDRYEQLVAQCEQIMADPPSTSEPLKYPDTMKRGSHEWVLHWWGNRTTVINTLESAATLGFTRLLGGKDEYGELAKQILLDCAKWDPKGATNFRYNDEAGMPYAYHFARTYTFVHDLLSEEERELCRQVIRFRGQEMYEYLYPNHLWEPYVSHNTRSWHFLGELGIAVLGEVEGADDWVWFAANACSNVYPIWSDDDGGWHEGFSYWHSYLGRFTWWADVMRAAMDIDAYDNPYLSRTAGYYAMYLMPPGRIAGEFGDGSNREEGNSIVPLFGREALGEQASKAVPLMSRLAAESGNGHWQWYVEQMGGAVETPGYIGFIHGIRPKVDSIPPDDLPTSRLFRGIGVASLNTTLNSAAEDVQILFKSSPMGTQSHGIDSNNSFALWAYGQRMLINTGHYYMYGGPHHRDWVRDTKSQNNITVNGYGQVKHSPSSKGRIVAFKTTPSMDVVIGEAGEAYRVAGDGTDRHLLDRYTRAILFVKPELIIVFDRLQAPQPSTFKYWLHALNKFELAGQRNIVVQADDVVCDIDLMAPSGLALAQTDQYDPNPWPQITARDWHLTATTPSKTKSAEFVALYRPHRKNQTVPQEAELNRMEGGYILTADVSDGRIVALLPTSDEAALAAEGLKTTGAIIIQRRRLDGSIAETIRTSE